jgi:tetratricopeptide (TPR) repeat protein
MQIYSGIDIDIWKSNNIIIENGVTTMQNRNHHRKKAVEFFDLAAAEFENKEYDRALSFEEQADQELKKAHSDDHAHVDSYIKALHFCRTAYILYTQGKKEDTNNRFHTAFKAFEDLSAKDLTHEMYVYFAQAHYSQALMYAVVEKDYKKGTEAAHQAIQVIKKIPSHQHTAEDDVYKLSYEMLITMDDAALHPEKSQKLWEKFAEKIQDAYGHHLASFKIKNNVEYRLKQTRPETCSEQYPDYWYRTGIHYCVPTLFSNLKCRNLLQHLMQLTNLKIN